MYRQNTVYEIPFQKVSFLSFMRNETSWLIFKHRDAVNINNYEYSVG